MGRAALVVAAGIAASRLLGLARNVALAALLGTTVEGDAYQAAFVVPDVLFYLMAGGYLTVTFIPLVSRAVAEGDHVSVDRTFVAIFRPVAAVMVALTALAMVGADTLVALAFPRFDAATAAQVADLTRIVLPAQVFFVLGSLLMGVQYAHGRFLVPSLAPVVYNAGIIAGGLTSWALGDPSPSGFAWGALAGAAVGNFALQAWGAARTGLRWHRGVPWRHRAFAEYLVLAVPLMAGQSVAVLDEQFVRLFGQVGTTGSIAALSLARRLNMVPVGLVAQAAGVAAYPTLARLFAVGDEEGLRRSVRTAIRYTFFAAALAMAGTVALARPAVRVAYQHGTFTSDDTLAAAAALAVYGWSIPFWGIQQVYARAFYARRSMWPPVVIGTIGTAVAVPLYVALRTAWIGPRGVPIGVAVASTISVVLYGIAIAWWWHRRHDASGLAEIVASAGRSLLAALPSGAVAWAVARAFGPAETLGLGAALLALVLGGGAAVVVYRVAAGMLGAEEATVLGRRSPRA